MASRCTGPHFWASYSTAAENFILRQPTSSLLSQSGLPEGPRTFFKRIFLCTISYWIRLWPGCKFLFISFTFIYFLALQCSMRDFSSLTRDQTHILCKEIRILNHWTTGLQAFLGSSSCILSLFWPNPASLHSSYLPLGLWQEKYLANLFTHH